MNERESALTPPHAGTTVRMGEPGRDAHATLLHSFIGALNADAAWLILDAGDGMVSPLSAWDPEGLGEPQRWFGGRFLGRVLKSKGATVGFAKAPDPHRIVPHRDVSNGIAYAVGSRVVVPESEGVALCAGFAEPPAEDGDRLLWATDMFAAVAALQLQDIGGFGRVIRGSTHDALTGCLTYGGLIDAVEGEIARSARRGHLLSCCFLDLDDFNEVNGRRGHMVGNQVLAAVGEALRNQIRPYDVVGRFGGDEFVALLPETGQRDALALAERVRRATRDAASAAAGMPVDLTFGVAEWRQGMSKDELLENADQALRIAKPDQSSSGDGPPASRSALDRDPKRELERIFGDGSSGDWWRL